MSNPTKKDQTQELIKETTKKLFFVQGRFDVTTQEIADEAGVNRTLIKLLLPVERQSCTGCF